MVGIICSSMTWTTCAGAAPRHWSVRQGDAAAVRALLAVPEGRHMTLAPRQPNHWLYAGGGGRGGGGGAATWWGWRARRCRFACCPKIRLMGAAMDGAGRQRLPWSACADAPQVVNFWATDGAHPACMSCLCSTPFTAATTPGAGRCWVWPSIRRRLCSSFCANCPGLPVAFGRARGVGRRVPWANLPGGCLSR